MTNDVLTDAFSRLQEEVESVLEGLSDEDLLFRPSEKANSIAWLIWHLTRVQDDHIAGLKESEQVYTANGWEQHFGLPFADTDTGYGHTHEDVAKVKASAKLLKNYYDDVHAATLDFIKNLKGPDYDHVVDEEYDPPVTLAVRIVSVLSDDLQHVGQAAYVRGLLAGN